MIGNVTFNKTEYAYVGPCLAGDLVLSFGSVVLDVSLEQMQDQISDGKCRWLIWEGAQIILGYPILRSIYMVVDLDSNEVSVAQAKFNTTDSHTLEISKQGIPKATAASSPISTAAESATANPISTVLVKLPLAGDGASLRVAYSFMALPLLEGAILLLLQ